MIAKEHGVMLSLSAGMIVSEIVCVSVPKWDHMAQNISLGFFIGFFLLFGGTMAYQNHQANNKYRDAMAKIDRDFEKNMKELRKSLRATSMTINLPSTPFDPNEEALEDMRRRGM